MRGTHRSGSWLCSFSVFPLFITTFLIASSAGTAAESPTNLTVLFLDASPTNPGDDEEVHGGLLIRELVRQAILIAARDGLGVVTRDSVLGEFDPDKFQPGQLHVITRAQSRKSLKVYLEQGPIGSRIGVWEKEIPLSSKMPPLMVNKTIVQATVRDKEIDYQELAATWEKLSRTELTKALESAGFKRSSIPSAGNAAVPADVEKALGELSFISQFAAVRKLHAIARAQGESPAILGGLVRGYANLSQLVSNHWTVTGKVFKARALLYADRLSAQQPNQPLSYWYQAYAQALAGFPVPALASLDKAQKAYQADKSKDAKAAGEPPDWAAVLDAFCRCDQARLEKATREKGQAQALAMLLGYLNLKPQTRGILFVDLTKAGLTRYPECYLFYTGIYNSGQLGLQHAYMAAAPQAFGGLTLRRLATLEGLPDTVRQAVERGNGRGDQNSTARAAKDLIEAGASSKDTGEPSWAVLGQMLREELFLLCFHSAGFLRDCLGVGGEDTAQAVRAMLPLVEGHRYRNYIASFGVDPRMRPAEYLVLLDHIPLRDSTFALIPLESAIQRARRDRSGRRNSVFIRATQAHADACADDIAEGIVTQWLYYSMKPGESLARVSPYSPVAVIGMLHDDWKSALPHLKEWETQFKDSPAVLFALAAGYEREKQFADAERCMRAYVARAPDTKAYTTLANICRLQGNEQGWQDALEQALKTEDAGLTHASVRAELANYFMDKKEWKKALPYANQAAQTGAYWAMQCASECHEGLGDWKEAEGLVRQISERYDSGALEWFYWCVRTGHGDIEAARELAKKSVEQAAESSDIGLLYYAAFFYLLDEKHKDAMQILRKLEGSEETSPFVLLWEAVAADEMKDSKTRDDLLRRLAKTPAWIPSGTLFKSPQKQPWKRGSRLSAPPRTPGSNWLTQDPKARDLASLEMGGLLKKALAMQTGLELKDVEAATRYLHTDNQVNYYYIAGRFLELHDRAKDAIPYYQICMNGNPYNSFGYFAAARRLRLLGVDAKANQEPVK